MSRKSKLHLKKHTVSNLEALHYEDQKNAKAGKITRIECGTDPVTNSYHYRSCGPECTYDLTDWCDMTYIC